MAEDRLPKVLARRFSTRTRSDCSRKRRALSSSICVLSDVPGVDDAARVLLPKFVKVLPKLTGGDARREAGMFKDGHVEVNCDLAAGETGDGVLGNVAGSAAGPKGRSPRTQYPCGEGAELRCDGEAAS